MKPGKQTMSLTGERSSETDDGVGETDHIPDRPTGLHNPKVPQRSRETLGVCNYPGNLRERGRRETRQLSEQLPRGPGPCNMPWESQVWGSSIVRAFFAHFSRFFRAFFALFSRILKMGLELFSRFFRALFLPNWGSSIFRAFFALFSRFFRALLWNIWGSSIFRAFFALFKNGVRERPATSARDLATIRATRQPPRETGNLRERLGNDADSPGNLRERPATSARDLATSNSKFGARAFFALFSRIFFAQIWGSSIFRAFFAHFFAHSWGSSIFRALCAHSWGSSIFVRAVGARAFFERRKHFQDKVRVSF